MKNPEHPFNIIDNSLEDIVSYIVDDYNKESEVEYLNNLIRDLTFIKDSYLLKEDGEYWDEE